MCGRTACTLAPDEVCKAASIRKQDKLNNKTVYTSPQWRDHPGDHNYTPSTNIAPTSFTPILLREDSLSKRDIDGTPKECQENYVIQPMMWGLVPFFFVGDTPTKHGYQTNNCRLEGIKEKKMFKHCLQRNQRCVVLCEGFYEWHNPKGSKSKQPYLVYAVQPSGLKFWNRSEWENKENLFSEEEGWQGPNLLKMAGLYSVWTSTEGEKVFNYCVITRESGDNFQWLHHRIPAILDTEEDIQMWLDTINVDVDSALSLLKPPKAFEYHKVSALVNNTKNKGEYLMQPAREESPNKPSASSSLMANWLKKGKSGNKD